MNEANDLNLIESAEREWNRAIQFQNVELAKSFMAEDYVLVGVRSTGSSIVDLGQWLEGLATMQEGGPLESGVAALEPVLASIKG